MTADHCNTLVENGCPSQLKWLDFSFLQSCVQRMNDDKSLKVVSFDVAPATKKGENFNSDIFRVSVHYTDSKSSDDKPSIFNIIVKMALGGESAVGALNELNVYEKEMEIYEKILPELKKMLRATGAGGKLFADTIYVSKSHQSIFLEDLSVGGYYSKNVKDGFGMSHSKAILSALAKYHAAASVLQERQPDVYENFKYGLINRNVSTLNIFHLTMLDVIVELISEWPDFAYYADKLRKFRPLLIEREQQVLDAAPNEFNTLTHGDFWFTNTMLKYDQDDNLEDLALIDFQFNCWTSPAIDLHYFFASSIDEDLRMHHQQELVQHYHKELTTVLKRLNYQKHIPTLLEFQLQFTAKSLWGFTASCLISPIQLTDDCDDADVDAVLGTDERGMLFKRLAVHSPRMQKKLRALIPRFESLGIFDCDAE